MPQTTPSLSTLVCISYNNTSDSDPLDTHVDLDCRSAIVRRLRLRPRRARVRAVSGRIERGQRNRVEVYGRACL